MTAKPAEGGRKQTAKRGTGWASKKISPETVEMAGRPGPSARATVTSYTVVTLSLIDRECPLISTQNCTSRSKGGKPTMSEASLAYKVWILGKCMCVCVRTCALPCASGRLRLHWVFPAAAITKISWTLCADIWEAVGLFSFLLGYLSSSLHFSGQFPHRETSNCAKQI